jgi:hypothetical protein
MQVGSVIPSETKAGEKKCSHNWHQKTNPGYLTAGPLRTVPEPRCIVLLIQLEVRIREILGIHF